MDESTDAAKPSDTGTRPWWLGSDIQELNKIIVGELAEHGEWIVANVQTNSFWPVNAQKHLYRGEVIWILPLTQKHFPAVAMRAQPGKPRRDSERLLLRFLSTLSWVMEHGLSVDGFSGGNHPRPMGRDKTFGFAITQEFDLSYFPEPADQKALLALALMREGRSLNHPGYAFLSFYRVLEVAFPDGRLRGEWVARQIASPSDQAAKEVA